MNIEKERKQLEEEKKKLIQEKEVIKLRSEVEKMKKENEVPSIAGQFGRRWLRGAAVVGKGLGNVAMRVGEKLSKTDVTEATGLKRKDGFKN